MPNSRARNLYQRLVGGGQPVIDELIQARESEAYFLDFKRSSDNGGGPKLHTTDRKNLAKAISGFGNSEGGVIVWGVDCSETAGQGDVAQAKFPLHDATGFRARLEGIVSECTVPGHERVVSHAITSGATQGYVVTYIPKSVHAPHQDGPRPPLLHALRIGFCFGSARLAGGDVRPAPTASRLSKLRCEPANRYRGSSVRRMRDRRVQSRTGHGQRHLCRGDRPVPAGP